MAYSTLKPGDVAPGALLLGHDTWEIRFKSGEEIVRYHDDSARYWQGVLNLHVTGLEGKRPGDSCGICGTKLGVLLQSVFCPKDCDTPASVQARKERDEATVQRVRDYNRANLDWYGKNPP